MQRGIIHQEFWSRSVEGRSIELYRKDNTLSSRFQGKRPYIFIGGVHGDEPEGVRLALDLLAWLQKGTPSEFSHNQGPHDDLHPWILIPCLNVDGYARNQRTNSQGVDLNRNFPTKNWQASKPGERYYTGPGPASEVEVQSLIQLIIAEKPEAIFHFHSWEPCLVYTGEPGRKWAQLLALGNNYPLKDDIGYPTLGSLGEWGWHETSTPVVCIEEQEHIDLSLVWPHFREGLIKILQGKEEL